MERKRDVLLSDPHRSVRTYQSVDPVADHEFIVFFLHDDHQATVIHLDFKFEGEARCPAACRRNAGGGPGQGTTRRRQTSPPTTAPPIPPAGLVSC